MAKLTSEEVTEASKSTRQYAESPEEMVSHKSYLRNGLASSAEMVSVRIQVSLPLMRVPLFDTDTPLAGLRDQIIERVAEVIRGGRYILGPEVAAFEQELADYRGRRATRSEWETEPMR